MPDDQHPGFEYWQVNQPGFPHPVGDITVVYGNEQGAQAHAGFTVPQAQPTATTVAEKYVGIAHSAKLWWALECTTDAQGKVSCEALLRGQHLHWFPEHGESAPGPVQEIRLTAAELGGRGDRLVVAGHGSHCDTFTVMWFQIPGKLRCDLTVTHWAMSEREFREEREKSRRRAEHKTIVRPEPVPDPGGPTPAPPPKPELGPDGG